MHKLEMFRLLQAVKVSIKTLCGGIKHTRLACPGEISVASNAHPPRVSDFVTG